MKLKTTWRYYLTPSRCVAGRKQTPGFRENVGKEGSLFSASGSTNLILSLWKSVQWLVNNGILFSYEKMKSWTLQEKWMDSEVQYWVRQPKLREKKISACSFSHVDPGLWYVMSGKMQAWVEYNIYKSNRERVALGVREDRMQPKGHVSHEIRWKAPFF